MNQRNIKYIVVHCTATPTTTTLESIKRYWKEQRGWGDTPGYHYFIKRDGTIVQLFDEKKNSYGVYKHNSECISIAYVGGIDKDGKPVDNRSDAQKHAMFNIIVRLTEKYPKAEVLGHRDFPGVKKACPCFDVKEWLKNYEPDFNSAA
ncbi:MAG: N-acetylmuramoyl-L-alanine amidase [Bacteroidia bacterium]|nr:N-acetylmuramoyl-L-alanine amidase [Bacteroidia bacterium]